MQVKSIAEILSTFIRLPFVFKTFVLSIFEWPLKTGFTVKGSQVKFFKLHCVSVPWHDPNVLKTWEMFSGLFQHSVMIGQIGNQGTQADERADENCHEWWEKVELRLVKLPSLPSLF